MKMKCILLKTLLFIVIFHLSRQNICEESQRCDCTYEGWKLNVDCYDYEGDFPSLPLNTTSFSLTDSKVEKLPDDAFKNNHFLETVTISYSVLYDIEERAFREAKAIKSVSLIGNKFKRLRANVFRRIDSLRSLILLRNSLHTIDYGFLGGNSMKLVKIGFNRLTEIRRDIFIDAMIEELIVINSSKLIMTNGEFFQWMRNSIKVVSFTNVPVVHPENRLSFKNLRLDKLILRNAGLKDLSKLNGLTTKHLDISNNQIDWSSTKSSNFSIDSLSCETTGLKDLHLLSLAFPRIKTLSAAYNKIESIPSQGLVGLFPLMTKVDFSNNLFTELHPRDVAYLKTANFNYCKLRTIYNEQHGFSKKLTDMLQDGLQLKFNGNKFHCNCQLRWLYDYLKSQRSYSFFSTKCQTPQFSHFINMKESNFSCVAAQIVTFSKFLIGKTSVRLTCEATGDPLPMLQIHFREDGLIKTEKITVRNPDPKFKRNRLSVVYTRDNSVHSDLIAYCVARNEKDTVDAVITLTSLLGITRSQPTPTTMTRKSSTTKPTTLKASSNPTKEFETTPSTSKTVVNTKSFSKTTLTPSPSTTPLPESSSTMDNFKTTVNVETTRRSSKGSSTLSEHHTEPRTTSPSLSKTTTAATTTATTKATTTAATMKVTEDRSTKVTSDSSKTKKSSLQWTTTQMPSSSRGDNKSSQESKTTRRSSKGSSTLSEHHTEPRTTSPSLSTTTTTKATTTAGTMKVTEERSTKVTSESSKTKKSSLQWTTTQMPSSSRGDNESSQEPKKSTESTTSASPISTTLTNAVSTSTKAPSIEESLTKIKVTIIEKGNSKVSLTCKSNLNEKLTLQLFTSKNKSQEFTIVDEQFSIRTDNSNQISFYIGNPSDDDTPALASLNEDCPTICNCRDQSITCPASDENIMEIPKLSANSQFTKLFINKGNLEVLDSSSFQGYDNFEEILLSNCNLKTLHKNTFSKMRNLKSISIWNNDELQSIPEGIFLNNRELQYISMSTNGIQELPRNFVRGLHLITVDLRSLQLKSLHHSVFSNSTMRNLFLSNNRKLSDWDPSEVVMHLNVSHLAINSIPMAKLQHSLDFSTLQAMERLDMSNTEISQLKFLDGVRTTDVIINHNHFESLPLHPQMDWTFLRYCNITNSKLISIDQLPSMPKILHLNLKENSITHLNQLNISKKFPNLEVLILSSNKISVFDANIITGFGSRLRSLFLNSNLLKTIPKPNQPIGEIWPAMKYFDLNENIFTCDCNVAWFYEWSYGNENISAPYCLIQIDQVRLLNEMPREGFNCSPRDIISFNYTMDDERVDVSCGNGDICSNSARISIEDEGYSGTRKTSSESRGAALVSYEYTENTIRLIIRCDISNPTNGTGIISKTKIINIRSKSTEDPQTRTTQTSIKTTSPQKQSLNSTGDSTDYSTIYLAVGLSLICLFIIILAAFAIRNWKIAKKFRKLQME
ncbi:unnamed protein product [Dimorphilus gyrociliatus]|uniref:LRRCT domain-containing protein n=1 Tax=Dimorphilus gyrociliatus TaxID=2664684 RepID=A0A7I8VJJ6_9ANNE|nr:unnamed protein product [Dimorphilus gyrociliatus]